MAELRTCVIIPSFPFGGMAKLCEAYMNQANPGTTNIYRVKHHFVPLDMKVFEREVLQHFDHVETFHYSEKFFDDNDFSKMKNKSWLKIKTKKGVKEFSKKETIIEECKVNVIAYKETKSSVIEHNDSSLGLVVINILVQRKHFVYSNTTFPLELTMDEAEFPDGERFTVFELFIDLPEHLLEPFQTLLEDLKEKDISVPVRSKIIQYLFTHHKDVYQVLEDQKYILESNHYKSKHLLLFENYHPKSILFQKWKKELLQLEVDKLKRVSENLGISEKRLQRLLKNKLVDEKVREIISRYIQYSPLTKKTLQEKELTKEDQCKFIDFDNMGIEKTLRSKLRDSEHVLSFSIPTLYGIPLVEFFGKREHFGNLEKHFEDEIKSGIVRLSHKTQPNILNPFVNLGITIMEDTSVDA